MNILNIDAAFEGTPITDHGISVENLFDRLVRQQEPCLFASKYPVTIGEQVFLETTPQTSGYIARTLTREEFVEWERRVFSCERSMLDANDKYFFEVRAD